MIAPVKATRVYKSRVALFVASCSSCITLSSSDCFGCMAAFNLQHSVEISARDFYELLSVLSSLAVARPVFGLLFGVREALQTELQGAPVSRRCHTITELRRSNCTATVVTHSCNCCNRRRFMPLRTSLLWSVTHGDTLT